MGQAYTGRHIEAGFEAQIRKDVDDSLKTKGKDKRRGRSAKRSTERSTERGSAELTVEASRRSLTPKSQSSRRKAPAQVRTAELEL